MASGSSLLRICYRKAALDDNAKKVYRPLSVGTHQHLVKAGLLQKKFQNRG